jgi:LemA protein
MRWLWLLLVVAVLAALYVWYATIVARRNKVREALGSVDVHLAQRHDLIPNIVKLAARFMEHERGLMEQVARLRGEVLQAPAGTEARFKLEEELGRQAGRLVARLEAYPQLKSDATVMEAQRTWTEVEGQLAAARRFYNAAVADLANAVQIFPGSVLARLAGVTVPPFFEAAPEQRAAPDVDAILAPRP